MKGRRLLIWCLLLPMVGTVAHSKESRTEDGALYATGGRDGVTCESCLLSNDQPIQHFVLFDSGNFVLLASLGWTIDLDLPEGAENGIQMYEYPDDVECNQGRCETTERIYRFGQSNVEEVPITWTARCVNSEMDVLIFETSEGDVRATCASFPVNGVTCRKVVTKLQDFVARERFQPERIRLSDQWCE